MARMTLPSAIEDLYTKARKEGKATSARRLDALSKFCVEQLESRGVKGALVEPRLPGFARAKNWDVAWFHREKVRLAISLKSILTNLGGTVPNRVDDLMGEVTNLQMFSPEVVIGYLMVFNVEDDTETTRHGCTWGDLLSRRLEALSGRRAPHWTAGTVEAAVVVRVDFSRGPALLTGEEPVSRFFDLLVDQVLSRNPDLRAGDSKG